MAEKQRRDLAMGPKELGGILWHQARRIVEEGVSQLKHSFAHGSTELMSAFYTGSAFVQYQSKPADVLDGQDRAVAAAEAVAAVEGPALGPGRSTDAIAAEMREDYALRAQFDRSVDPSDMQMGALSPIEPPRQDGMSW